MYLWTRVQFLATDFRRLRCVSSAYAYTRNQYSFFEREQLFRSRNCSTNTQSPTRLSWGFFSSVSACCPVLLRVRAETCGLRPLRGQTGSAPDSLSSGHFSQYPRRPEMGRSPQGSLSMAKKINNLRVDESIGLFAALVGDQKSQPSGFGCGGLRKAGAGQKRTSVTT